MPVHSVLVVCAANICRSPSAAELLATLLRERGSRIVVVSAGVTAVGDRPACDLALSLVGHATTRRYAFEGIEDVSSHAGSHRSRRITLTDIETADVIVVMEQWHADEVLALAPDADVRLLDPSGDIPDPHAIGYESHAAVFGRLRAAVAVVADELAGEKSD